MSAREARLISGYRRTPVPRGGNAGGRRRDRHAGLRGLAVLLMLLPGGSVAEASLMLLLGASAAEASLSRADLAAAGVAPPAGARLDLSLVAADATGARRTIGAALAGRPAFLIFVDYRCDTLCGTELQLLSAAIESARLDPADFRILAIGIDPRASPAAALDLEQQEVPPALRAAIVLLLPDQETLTRAAKALGFAFVYDPAADRFAHPAAVYVLAADGTVKDVLSPFSLLAGDARTVLSASGAGPPDLRRRVMLLCYAYDPATGRYNVRVDAILKSAAGVTVFLLGGALLLLPRAGKQPR